MPGMSSFPIPCRPADPRLTFSYAGGQGLHGGVEMSAFCEQSSAPEAYPSTGTIRGTVTTDSNTTGQKPNSKALPEAPAGTRSTT